MRSGVGTFLYANGTKYVGDWHKNMKHGHGVFTFEDGSVYEGPFAHDKMVETTREALENADGAIQPHIRLKVGDLIPGATLGARHMAPTAHPDGHDRELDEALKKLGFGETLDGKPPPPALASLEKMVLRYNS